jgi:hypothetical protein
MIGCFCYGSSSGTEARPALLPRRAPRHDTKVGLRSFVNSSRSDGWVTRRRLENGPIDLKGMKGWRRLAFEIVTCSSGRGRDERLKRLRNANSRRQDSAAARGFERIYLLGHPR